MYVFMYVWFVSVCARACVPFHCARALVARRREICVANLCVRVPALRTHSCGTLGTCGIYILARDARVCRFARVRRRRHVEMPHDDRAVG